MRTKNLFHINHGGFAGLLAMRIPTAIMSPSRLPEQSWTHCLDDEVPGLTPPTARKSPMGVTDHGSPRRYGVRQTGRATQLGAVSGLPPNQACCRVGYMSQTANRVDISGATAL
ncbi:hypothetical protein MAHJHV61_33090 [Mycobacterium avium subsp. hominissuis]